MREILKINEKFFRWCEAFNKTNGDKGLGFLLGLSGGADSMVLLDCCLRARETGLVRDISVVHVNHLLRGQESHDDASFVLKSCSDNSVHCEVLSADVSKYSRRMKKSIEESARILRYLSFSKALGRSGKNFLLLGHNLTDQHETFFMRLLRGTGIGGLECMSDNDPFPFEFDQETADYRVLRPLLSSSRDEIRHFASKEGIDFREDSSNQDLSHFRNRVRHILMPALDEVNGSRNWAQPVSDLMNISSLTHDVIKSASKQWQEKRYWNGIEDFDVLPAAIKQQIIIDQLSLLRIAHPISRIRQLLETKSSWINTGKGEFIKLGEDGCISKRIEDDLPLKSPNKWKHEQLRLRLDRLPFQKSFMNLEVSWSFQESLNLDAVRNTRSELFDADMIGDEIILRFWQPGDVFHPCGFTKPIKLKKWFSSQRIPENERSHRVIAESLNIGIFWVQGMRIAENSKITGKSKRGLTWEWQFSQSKDQIS